MSNITGKLFVDVEGNTDGLRQSLKRSERDVSKFGKAVNSTMAESGIASLLRVGGAAALTGFARGRTPQSGFGANRGSRLELQSQRAQMRRDVRLQNYRQRAGMDISGDGARFAAQRAAIKSRQRDLVEGRGRQMARGSFARNLLPNAIRLMKHPAFIAAAAVAAIGVMGLAEGNARAKAARGFDARAIREDAITNAQKIKQDIQIARRMSGQGFAGNAARFRNSQSAGLAPFMGTVGNIGGGFWDSFMGLLMFNMRGGILGGGIRVITGGNFI